MKGVRKKDRSDTHRMLNHAVGKAIHRYGMISDGDRIAVGVSGGMDSLVLMWVLTERLQRIPVTYELFPLHIDPGFEKGGCVSLEEYCRANGYPLRVLATDIGVRAHHPENRENPCFLCSREKRKALFDLASELGCNKLALGHHRDDIIETFFLNLCYAGELSTMLPCQSLFKGTLDIIRPLSFADKDLIGRFGKERGFPLLENPCPSAGRSKREEIKGTLMALYQGNDKVKGNIFRALSHPKPEYLLK